MSGVVTGDAQGAPVFLNVFLYQMGASFGLAVAGLALFGFLQPKFKKIYNRRRSNDPSKSFSSLPKGALKWVFKVWHEPDEGIISKSGLDAFMYLKFIQLSHTYTFLMLALAVGLSIVNLSGGSLTGVGSKGWQKIDMKILTIANITNKEFLWAHVIASWFSAIVLGVLIYKNNIMFISLRQKYFSSSSYQSKLHSRTLLLTQLPRPLRSDQGINNFINNLGLRQPPEFCTVGRRVGHLPQLVREYNLTIRKFESILARAASSSSGKRPQNHLGRFGWLGVGPQVDSIEYYLGKLDELRDEIFELRSLAREGLPVTRVGFIIYPDAKTAHLTARQLGPGPGSLLSGNSPMPDVVLSPPPEDLIWSNLLLPRRQQFLRWLFFTVVFVGMLIAGAFIFGGLGAISSVNSIITAYPSTASAFPNTAVNSLIDSILAPLIMLMAIFIVQYLLRSLSEMQSAATRSSVERRLMAKFLSFLVINNLVVFSSLQAKNSVLNSLNSLGIYDFQSLVISFKTILPALGIPFSGGIISTSSFWTSQMSLRILSYLVELTQPITLLKFFQTTVRRRGALWVPGIATTPREYRELQKPVKFAYPIGYAIQAFNLTLIMVFGIVAPLIVPFGAVNFTVAYIVYKHQIMYVHSGHHQKRDMGGRLYATAFHSILIIWILSQFLLITILLLKSSTNAQWYSLLPLPFLLALFGMAHRSWFDAHLDLLDLGVPSAPSNPHLRTTAPHRTTGQDVEMAYINPIIHSGFPTNNNTVTNTLASHNGHLDVPSRPSTPSSSSFVHHPALDQELLTLDFDSNLLLYYPELERHGPESSTRFNVERPHASPQPPTSLILPEDFHQNDEEEEGWERKWLGNHHDSPSSNSTPHF